MHQDFNEEPGDFVHLEEALSLKDIGSDKIAGFQMLLLDEEWSQVTSAAEAENLRSLPQA